MYIKLKKTDGADAVSFFHRINYSGNRGLIVGGIKCLLMQNTKQRDTNPLVYLKQKYARFLVITGMEIKEGAFQNIEAASGL